MNFFPIIPVLCLFAGISAPGDEDPPEKTVSAVFLSASSKTSWEPGIENPGKKFRIKLGFSIPGVAKIIDCRDKDIRLDIRDSTGGGGAPSDYDNLLNSDEPELRSNMEHWIPSPEARWVSIKGNIPLLIAEKEVTSEGVLFSMDEKKEEKTLVLKESALMDDGRLKDVKTSLKIEWSLSKDSGKIKLAVTLKSPCILGICDVTLMKSNGTPILGKNWNWDRSSASNGCCMWNWEYSLDPGEQGKIKVLVNYMTELKRINVPVDMKFGLSGMLQETLQQ